MSLMNMLEINFQLIQHHKYSLFEIESLIPWERDIYIEQLRQYIEEQNLKNLQAAANNRKR